MLEAFFLALVGVLAYQCIGVALFLPIELAFPKERIPFRDRAGGFIFLLATGIVSAVIATVLTAVRSMLHITPIPLNLGIASPLLAAIVAALWIDLQFYTVHRIEHRFFWRFHAVHHSIKNLSAANSYHHWSEAIMGLTVMIPLMFVDVQIGPTLALLAFLFRFQQFYIHSSSRPHFGPLRWLLVDNRYHRIHHSVQPEHHDRNFGAMSPLWDWLFGKLHMPKSSDWPVVGLADLDEPHSLKDWATAPWRLKPAEIRETDGCSFQTGLGSHNRLRDLALIIAAEVAVRLLTLALYDPGSVRLSGDSSYYMADALRLRATGILTPGHPLMYQLFLALVPWPLVVQSALTITSGALTYFRFGGRVGFWTGLAIAVCPFFAILDFRLYTESLAMNLLWWAWLALGRNGLIAGLFLGFALLTRDTLMFLPAVAFAALRTRKAGQMAILAYVVALPWLLYPSDSGRPAVALWIGTWERNMDWQREGMDKPNFPASAHVTPAERASYMTLVGPNPGDGAYLKTAAIERIVSSPGEVLSVWVERYPKLWNWSNLRMMPVRDSGPVAPVVFVELMLAFMLLGFGAWGILSARAFAIPVIYTALIYIPFHNAESRYSLIALPFLIYGAVRKLNRAADALQTPTP